MNESINQSINQSNNQLFIHSIMHWFIDHSIDRSIILSFNRLIDQSMSLLLFLMGKSSFQVNDYFETYIRLHKMSLLHKPWYIKF